MSCVCDGSPLECLVAQVEQGKLTIENNCIKHLFELEYFITRNFKLDKKMYEACREDVTVSIP